MKFLIENELEKRHKKHKKTIKPGAIGSFIHPDGGNQVAIDTFNNSVDMGNISSACGLGEALNESIYDDDNIEELAQYYMENAFGFDGLKDFIETQYPYHSKEDKKVVLKKLKKRLGESINEGAVVGGELMGSLPYGYWNRPYTHKNTKNYDHEWVGKVIRDKDHQDYSDYVIVDVDDNEYIDCISLKNLARKDFNGRNRLRISNRPQVWDFTGKTIDVKNVIDKIRLTEDYVEDKLKKLISVQHFISPKDDIQLFTTEKGNYLVKRNGKQMMILDKKNFRESDIEDLRLNGYFRDYDKARMNESIESEDAFERIKKNLAEILKEAGDRAFEFEAEFPVADKDKFFYDLLDEYNISDYDIIESDITTAKDGEKWYYFYGVLHPFRSLFDENGAEYGYKYESLEDEKAEDNSNNTLKEKVIKAIQDEWKTIAFYNDLIETLKEAELFDEINIIKDINEEEHIHVGQLQSLLSILGGDAAAIEQGQQEAAEQLDEDINTDNAKEIKYLQNRLVEINKAIEAGDDPERWSKLKERIMDKLDKFGANYYTESLHDSLEDKINAFIEDSRGYADYDQIVEDVADEFDLSKQEAEDRVWNYMYTIGHDVNNIKEEMRDDSTTNTLYALRNFKKHAQNGDELKIDINGNKGEVSKEADGWYLYYGGLVTQGSYKIIEATVKDAIMRAEAKKSMQESFDPYSVEYWNYDKEEIDKGVDYCKNHNIDINTLNDYDFENIVILANKYYASKPDWKYTDDEILAGLNLLYDEGAMLSNLDADGVEYYIKKANNIEECYKMTNKEIKEALNKLDMWAIDNDTTFHDLKTLYEAFVNPNSPVDQKKKDKIQKALNDPTLNKDKEKLQDYISGVLSRQEESLEETLEDEEEFNNFKSANKNHNKVFDNKKFGKYFDKNGHLIPEKAKEYWAEFNKPLTEGVKPVIIPKPYDEYFEVDTINVSDDDFYDYKPGDKIDGYDCHFIAYLIPKIEEVEDIYPVLTDDPKYPVCELIADRLIPVDLPEDLS